MNVGYITFEESTINSLMKNPAFADGLMAEILADGDEEEISYFQSLYDEAKARMFGTVKELAMA